jgi:osmotically-inducible protein OsmY
MSMHDVDSDVTTLVTKALLQGQGSWTAVFEVGSREGVVRLSGIVSSEEGRRAVEEIARQQGGVREVVNEIQVQPDTEGLLRALVGAVMAGIGRMSLA